MVKRLYFQYKLKSHDGLFNPLDIINTLKQRYNNDINLFNKKSDDELIKYFDFKTIGYETDEYDYMRLYEIRNKQIIEIIMNLEHKQEYDKSTDNLVVMYYINIKDDYEKYINISYSCISSDKYIHHNKIAKANDYNKQYLVINKYDVDIHDFWDHPNFGEKYYDVLFLYFDYDLYLKDNCNEYIKKVRNLFNNTFNITQLQKSISEMYSDNYITKYVDYKIIDN